MAGTKTKATTGSAHDTPSVPYTEERKQTYAFAKEERRVKTGATSVTLTNYEIMQRKQFETGVAGSPLAQRDYLRRADESAEARRAYIEQDCKFWTEVKAHNQEVLDRARAAGAPAPKVIPHPDDIKIDWETGVRLLGPASEAEWQACKQAADLRDCLNLQQAMEDAVDGVPMRERMRVGGARRHALFLNHLMPPSFRLSQMEDFDCIYPLMGRPQRQLLLDCRAAWRRLGVSVVRGQRYGTAEAFLPIIGAFLAALTAQESKADDPLGFEEAVQSAARATGTFITSAATPRSVSIRARKTKVPA